MTGRDELGERQCLPAVAARTVSIEPMAVLLHTGEGAEVDLGARLTLAEGQRVSRAARASASGFFTLCSAAKAHISVSDRVRL